MEYIEHGDLGQYIEKSWPQAKAEAKEITVQILEGLEVLHEREICHRDLKPQVSPHFIIEGWGILHLVNSLSR